MAVGVRDQSNGERVNARILFEVSFGELWQFVIITFGQVFANLAHLLFHDVKVVDQPFRGGRDDMLFANRIGECFVCGDQLAAILFEARQQQTNSMRFFGYLMLSGEGGGVLLEPLNAVQLLADRQVSAGVCGAFKPADQS